MSAAVSPSVASSLYEPSSPIRKSPWQQVIGHSSYLVLIACIIFISLLRSLVPRHSTQLSDACDASGASRFTILQAEQGGLVNN